MEQLQKEQYSISDLRMLSELGFDVVVCNKFRDIPWDCDLYFSWWASGSILPMIKAKLRGRPHVVVAGGNEAVLYKDTVSGKPLGYLRMPLYKKIATRVVLRWATVLTVVSKYMVPHVLHLSGGRSPIVIPNCVDALRFIPGCAYREYVTTIFRLDEEPTRIKRGEIFIRSIPYVLREYPETKFLLIGFKGNAFSRMLALARSLGVEDALVFAGAVKNEAVVQYMQRSKVYVQVSDTETFGVAVAEAMSTQTPVVVSNAGALPELTTGVGIVVDQNSPESVAQGVMYVLKMDEMAYRNLGEACRDIVIRKFNYDYRKQAFAQIFSDLGLPIAIAPDLKPN
jgi:glycosyltransferase involved in cell wall biosynthesis